MYGLSSVVVCVISCVLEEQEKITKWQAICDPVSDLFPPFSNMHSIMSHPLSCLLLQDDTNASGIKQPARLNLEDCGIN